MTKSSSASWIPPGLLFLFLVPMLAYAGYSVTDRWYQSYVLGEQETQLRRDISQLRDQNLRLQSELAYARGDAYIESVAREQLNLVKPGDRPIVLAGPAATSSPEPVARREPTPVATPEKTGWQRALDSVLGR